MKNELTETELLDELDGSTRKAVEAIRQGQPQPSQTLDSLKKIEAMSARNEPSTSVAPSRRKARWGTRSFWGAGIAATALVAIGFFAITAKPASSLASQMARSLASQDWIHVSQVFDGQVTNETWFSDSQGITARSTLDVTEFRDFFIGEFFWYSSVEKVLYRASNPHEQYTEFAELATCLPRLLSEELPEDPVKELPYMSRFNDFEERVHFISQEIVENDESNRVEYSISVLFDGEASNFTFIVDAESKLPLQVLMTGMVGEERKTLTLNIDYPETGPKNIYDMGIPKDAEIVNRIDSDEANLLMASVKAGAVRFDDYRAIVVRHDPDDKNWWINARVELVYRKGNRTRRSYCSPAFEPDGQFKIGPKPNDDLAVWWADAVSKTKDWGFGKGEGVLTEIRVGQHEWSFSQESVTKSRYPSDIPSFYSMVPEFQCRPPLGESGINFKININKNPKEGPKGTILFELVRTGHRNEAPDPDAENAPVQPTTLQDWIDPAKGHLVVRSDLGPDDSTTAEECAQSPSGIWYPTRALRTSKMPDGRISKQVTNYYVEFLAEIPDELFHIEN